MLDFDAHYDALRRRDATLDGVIFVAVRTTGIYCRPVCPFARHLDASPLQVALSIRVRRAKRLLDASDLPMAAVAERAGFSSTRRMSTAFTRLYGRPPSTFRRKAEAS
ncbi:MULTISPECIES: helix-turn-helix domain-containing protein [unclassified Bradyrhizobium]|jgi:methylphosphotriester-DNA--protein-cysteine methyltransferase|uniref:helix-turn-helix domain-containing protein n=1 Tax=unclassified Bradyrhizobium TaxID=2631580 RepID=UPI00104DCEFE|nr:MULTISPECIES: helix-turn-helix domain-containing protein [unclassified Bradyrhizobium]